MTQATRTRPVRTAPLADHPSALPTVAGWLHREWLQAWGLTPAQAEAELLPRLQHGALPLALVALAGDTPIGTASLVTDDHPLDPTPICALSGLYVLPTWRHRGVARLLCTHAVQLAQTLEHPQPRRPLGLYTLQAEAFYRHLGWTKVIDTPLPHPVAPTLGAYMEWQNNGVRVI